MRQLSMAGVPRYPTYRTRRSGLNAKTDGAPAAGVSPLGTSLPEPASIPKLTILSSSCRPTYSTSGMSFLLCHFPGSVETVHYRPRREFDEEGTMINPASLGV